VPKAFAEDFRIVAVVGDEVITNYDLQQRIRIISLTSGKIFTGQHYGVLANQIREVLITERLQHIEARKYGLVPSESKVLESYKSLANENKMTIKKFNKFLSDAGVSKDSFRSQIEATLTWQNLLINKIRSTINVSDFEIDDYIEQITESSGEVEYLVEIVDFPIKPGSNAFEIESLLEKIYVQVTNDKLTIDQVMKDFSANRSKTNEAVWRTKAGLADDIKEPVTLLSKGELSKPIKGESAYYLVLLKDKRVRKNIKNEEKLRAELYKKIFVQKLEAKADSYLKNLKRSTYIERKNI